MRLQFGSSVFAALLAVPLLALPPPTAFAASTDCPGLHVQVRDIRNSTGSVACALFESAAGFPIEFLHYATQVVVINIRASQARCDFEDLPPGTYAVAVIHDENMNGKLDTNWAGIPTEGYGFSNDAKAWLGAPTFLAAGFPYDGQRREITITLNY